MAKFDEESPFGTLPRPATTLHEIGQMLDLLSVSELRERVEMLRSEVSRLETQISAKEASRHAADAFFKF